MMIFINDMPYDGYVPASYCNQLLHVLEFLPNNLDFQLTKFKKRLD